MKTVDVDNCPKCGKPTTEKDYYWHIGTTTKNHPNCKECVCKKEKEKSQAKRDEAKLYF